MGEISPVFRDQPRSLPADLRRSWRVGLVLILVDACRGHNASRFQVQALAWIMLRPKLRQSLAQLLSPSDSLASPTVDLAIERALDLATGSGFLEETQKGRLALTVVGQEALRQIHDLDLFRVERETLSSLPSRFSQTDADRMFRLK
jgi:hypothetical protein